jgi:hypothetical protein
MKKLSNELNIGNYVEFKGRITNEELSKIVAYSWLNIHSSVTEGWGLSILEASASGTPTVAFNVPGVRDVIEDEMNGIKVKDGDRKALLEAAFKILSNPKRWCSSSIEVAKRYFYVQEGKNLRVHAQDGRLYLRRTPKRYDLILLDAYHADSIPFHLTTQEFFQIADQKLTTNGVTVINVIGAIIGSRSKIVRSLIKTLRKIFPQIYVFATNGADESSIGTLQNVIIIASKNKERLDIREIVKRAASLGGDLFPEPIEEINATYYEARMPTDDVPVLTDDYAPTDSLLHR